MAASSHTLVRGPITRRDWFSLRLGAGEEGERKSTFTEDHERH